MFFYTALIVASVIVALIILWLFNAIADAGKVVYSAILPSSKTNANQHLDKAVHVASTINSTRTPWGWKSGATPAREAHANPAKPSKQAPWGWPGNENEIREHGASAAYNAHLDDANAQLRSKETEKPNVGWPYREEKFEMAGKTYKVSRKVRPKRTNLATTGKPWGW
jgi:hypothetical protein